MSSGGIKCPKCEATFFDTEVVNGKITILEEPWNCPHCETKIVRDKEKGYGLKELEESK